MLVKLALSLALIEFATASYPKIAGYEPGSSVESHNAVDLDQAELEAALPDWVEVGSIYTTGGNSGGKVTLTISGGLAAAVSDGDELMVGNTLVGKSDDDFASGSETIKMAYGLSGADTTCTRSTSSGCITSGVLKDSSGNTLGTITDGSNSYRTLQGFSTAAPSKMEGQKYYEELEEYYGSGTFADDFIMDVIDGEHPWDDLDSASRGQLIKKGTVFLNVWLYVIREFEDAVADCVEGSITANAGNVHAWDEGVAFYTGTLEGTADGGSADAGVMLHNLADKRCTNYGTCTADLDGNPFTGKSDVNAKLFDLFALGRTHFQRGYCDQGAATKDRVAEIMTIPMVQGALRYAYKVTELSGGDEEAAEGTIFAMATMGRVNSCDTAAATKIATNTILSADRPSHSDLQQDGGFSEVWAAYQSVLPCLGITCADIGGLAEIPGDSLTETTYYDGFEPCTDPTTTTTKETVIKEENDMDQMLLIGLIVAAVVAVLGLVGYCMTAAQVRELRLKLPSDGGVAAVGGAVRAGRKV